MYDRVGLYRGKKSLCCVNNSKKHLTKRFMPGRAVRNAFIRQVEQHKQEITGCYQCLEKCNPKEVPYCITQALIHAVKGELEQGLIFCGENVSRIHEMTTVPELMRELTQG